MQYAINHKTESHKIEKDIPQDAGKEFVLDVLLLDVMLDVIRSTFIRSTFIYSFNIYLFVYIKRVRY